MLDLAFLPRDVGDALLGGEGTGALQHRRRRIDAGGMPYMRRESADHDATAASEIEERVVRPGPRGVDDQFQGRLVRDRRGGRERRRLAGELVADEILMRRVGHLDGTPCRSE